MADADRPTNRPGTDRRSKADRRSDHDAIARLADDLLPALIAKLSTTQLGELEVREDDWHVRLRRPYGVGPGEGRRAADKPSRSQPGHEGHGHARAGVESHRGGRPGAAASAGAPTGITAGSGAASAATNGASPRAHGRGRDSERSRSIAASPAVGIFQPGPKAASGTRVRAGDTLGTVDVLGVRQEVTAPADGVVGQTLVEPGMAVEYGQDLIRIELTGPVASGSGGASGTSAGAAGEAR